MSRPWENDPIVGGNTRPWESDPIGEAATQVQPQSPQGPVDFDIGTMISNIPSSAAKVAGETWSAVTDPVTTVKALGNLARGVAEKFGPLAQMLPEGEHEKYY